MENEKVLLQYLYNKRSNKNKKIQIQTFALNPKNNSISSSRDINKINIALDKSTKNVLNKQHTIILNSRNECNNNNIPIS